MTYLKSYSARGKRLNRPKIKRKSPAKKITRKPGSPKPLVTAQGAPGPGSLGTGPVFHDLPAKADEAVPSVSGDMAAAAAVRGDIDSAGRFEPFAPGFGTKPREPEPHPAPEDLGGKSPIDFNNMSLSKVIAQVNGRVADRSLALTDGEVTELADATAELLNKWLALDARLGPEAQFGLVCGGILIARVGHAFDWYKKRRLSKQQVEDIVTADVPDASLVTDWSQFH